MLEAVETPEAHAVDTDGLLIHAETGIGDSCLMVVGSTIARFQDPWHNIWWLCGPADGDRALPRRCRPRPERHGASHSATTRDRCARAPIT